MRSAERYHLRMSQMPLDATDERILEALQDDGRRSFRNIAREIGVSEGTVRTRVRRLEAAGALRFLAFVDPSQLGRRVLALVLVRVEAEHQRRHRRRRHGAGPRRRTSRACSGGPTSTCR